MSAPDMEAVQVSLDDAPMRIARLKVYGLERTDPDFVRRMLKPVMSASVRLTLADSRS